MSKVKIARKPTFDLLVTVVPVGGEKVEFNVAYKALRLSDYEAFVDRIQGPGRENHPDSAVVLEIAEGWDLDAPFTAEGINEVRQDLPGVCACISRRFIEEYERARWGN